MDAVRAKDDNVQDLLHPIPGRECGACNVCCVACHIDTPEIQKASGAVCRHCTDAGCAIFGTEARPSLCRDYYCGWRRMEMVPKDWRPDKSGVLIELQILPIPGSSYDALGLVLVLVGNPLRTIRDPMFCDFVMHCVNKRLPVRLALPGPVGKQSAQQPLGTPAMEKAMRRSRGEVKALLEKILKGLAAQEWVPDQTKNSGADFGI